MSPPPLDLKFEPEPEFTEIVDAEGPLGACGKPRGFEGELARSLKMTGITARDAAVDASGVDTEINGPAG